jgi:hypothetical protein
MLSSEVVPEGVYVPEVVVSKNVRKARGRMKVGGGRRGGGVWHVGGWAFAFVESRETWMQVNVARGLCAAGLMAGRGGQSGWGW